MAKRILLLLTVILSLTLELFSQDTYLRWARQLQEEAAQEVTGYSIKVDNTGNVYTAGVFFGNTDFDPGPASHVLQSMGEADIFISKLDANGNFVWAKSIGSLLYDYPDKIILDHAGNILITGFFIGTVDFDPGPGVFNMTSLGGNDIFFMKLSPQGDFLWAKKISGDRTEYGRGIVVDANDNVYITGLSSSSGSIDYDPGPGEVLIPPSCQTGLFILKLDSSGNFIWVKNFVGCNAYAEGINLAVDALENVYMLGSFQGTVDFDPGPAIYNVSSLSAGAAYDLVVLKLNSVGDFLWVKSVGAGVNPSSLTLDNLGNIYIAGEYWLPVDFDPGPGIFILTNSGNDCFVLKLNSDGNFIWVKPLKGAGEEWGNNVKVDTAGNVYTVGSFDGLVDFDPGPGLFTIPSNGFYDLFLSKLDAAGNFLWAKSIGGIGLDAAPALFLDNFGNIYLAGLFEATVDFDPELPIYNLTSTRYGGFVMKLGQCSNPSYLTLTINTCSSYTINNHVYSESGNYIEVLPNSVGCDSIITLNLTINRKFTSVNPSICAGQTYYAGGANQTSSGIYKDTLLTSLGCDSIITTTLTVHPKPKPDLGPDGNICQDAAAAFTPGVFNSYLWQDNSTLPSLIINAIGKYWVTVSDANNCTASDTLNVLAIDTVPKNFLPAGQQICYGSNLRITVPGYIDYLWSNNSKAGFIDINSFGTFYLTVRDFNNCTGTDSINIVQNSNCIPIGIPNAFTPNGDGKNDKFKPTINQAIQNFSFIVFNRYGEKVFETREYGKGWDGTYKGKEQPAGSYVYRILFTNTNGLESENNGSVLLIR